eukprot:2936099-Prorocentrum_lima.AAC.1
MTSSLVGSEMCIRDSQRLINRVHMDPWLTLSMLQKNETSLRRYVRWKSVSYTHLTLPTICSV